MGTDWTRKNTKDSSQDNIHGSDKKWIQNVNGKILQEETTYDARWQKAKLSVCLNKHCVMQTYEGVKNFLHALLISEVDAGKWLVSSPGHFIHWKGGWVNPTVDLDKK